MSEQIPWAVEDLHRAREVLVAPAPAPEGDRLNAGTLGCGDVRLGGERRQIALATRPRLLEMVRKMGTNDRCDPAGGDVRKVSQT